ncbi:MAG: MBL fold metallo-hydrolase [Cytophagales bacterium]|nr:MBL fold metallo-hydrolase [Cytophaga sp.]
MKVTFLGTGTSQGIPSIACKCDVCTSFDYRDKRLRTSVHIQTDKLSLIIDTGPDFRQQVLRERIDLLDAILFTHEHKDHIAGLDDVRGYNYAQQKDMPVYARANVIEALKREFAYIFADYRYPGIPRIDIHEMDGSPFSILGEEIIPIKVMHYKLPVFGFRIQDFTYITDANFIADEELEKIKGSKIVVLNALQKEPHVSHYTLDQAIEVIQKIQPDQAYFVHMGHRLGKHADITKELPANIHLSYDGLVLHL